MNDSFIKVHNQIASFCETIKITFPEITSFYEAGYLQNCIGRISLKVGCFMNTFKTYDICNTVDLTTYNELVDGVLFQTSDDRFTKEEDYRCQSELDEIDIKNITKSVEIFNMFKDYAGIYSIIFNGDKVKVFMCADNFLNFFNDEPYYICNYGYSLEYDNYEYVIDIYHETNLNYKAIWKKNWNDFIFGEMRNNR